MTITVKQPTAPRRVLWRGNQAPRVKLRCGRCGKHVITYVAPNLDHLGGVYVDLPSNGLIRRAGVNRYTLQCSRKDCPAEYTLGGDSIMRLVSTAALLGHRTEVLGSAIPSFLKVEALWLLRTLPEPDRSALARRLIA